MLEIVKLDHIGIRIRDRQVSIPFYQSLGFELLSDIGFEQGHPIMMRSESGVVLNLLGPSSDRSAKNVLMDIGEKHTGYTHIALKVSSLDAAEAYFNGQGYEITGRFSFKDMRALFIRDPDHNVIEFDEYPGDNPESRTTGKDPGDGYRSHP